MWQPIETCPQHTDVLFYREDAGVFFGQKTNCDGWVTEAEQEEHQYDEGTLWQVDCWYFGPYGAERLEGGMAPTHWMPLPTFFVNDMTDAAQDAMFYEAMDKDD